MFILLCILDKLVKIVSIFMLLVGKAVLDNVALIDPQKNLCKTISKNFVQNIDRKSFREYLKVIYVLVW